MRTELQQEEVAEAHRRAHRAAQLLRLPFRSTTWRGQTGNWMGAGIGSSIDFQDHRQYQLGDDVRYIDWNAYARTGHYIMKLYREEVSPAVDLVLDLSESMLFDDHKRRASLELFFFCLESAREWSGAPHCCFLVGEELQGAGLDRILAHNLPVSELPRGGGRAPDLSKVPWRAVSLRIFISDLLFAQEPAAAVRPLISSRGRGIVFAPYCAAEARPEWSGNLRLVDCERDYQREHRIDEPVLLRYLRAYRRHFELWKEHCRKCGVVLARIPAEAELEKALQVEALPEGGVELWA